MDEQQPFGVIVAGSLNMDLVVRVGRYPNRGETLAGDSFATFLGGKGYNQAVAATRSGSRVAMIGMLGEDDFGEQFLRSFQAEGIDGEFVGLTGETVTGIANIVVEANGANRIVIVAGANGYLGAEQVEAAASLFADAKVLLLQLETPLDSAIAAAKLAQENNLRVILTPAPVPSEPLPSELLQNVDILIMNEIEVFQLAELPPVLPNAEDNLPERIASARLLEMGVKSVLVTLGARGAAYFPPDGEPLVSPGFEVAVVDTTGAGDAFTGTLAARLAGDLAMPEALRAANVAGALACTRPGAATAIPYDKEIEAFLGR
jgi:ribokinase